MTLPRLLPAVFLVAALAAAPSEAGFVVSPMELHFEVDADREGALPLTITNKADAPLTVRLSLVDSRFGPDGTEENLDPGALPRSCAGWVRMTENVIDLEPREIRRISVVLDVPPRARGSYWTKMFIEEISSPQVTSTVQGERTYNIFMKQRIGVRIYEDVPGTTAPELIITNVTIAEGGDADPPSVLVDVRNHGNSILRCTGEVELRDAGGAIAEKVSMGSRGRFVVFPDGERRLAVKPRTKLSPGTYTALAIVDFGGDHLVAGDTLLEIDSPVVANQDDPEGS